MWWDARRLGEKGVGDSIYSQHTKEGKWELERGFRERFIAYGETS
jgi:hypothetical protein